MEFREIMRQFSKKELLGILEELGFDDVDIHSNTKNIIKVIADDLNENGIPAEEDCSSTLEEFLVVAGFIDESGDVLEDKEYEEEVVEEDAEEETAEVDNYEDLRPQCFSFHSSRDPACRKCKIAKECEEERLKILPSCYGKSFDERSEECKVCMENMSCRELVKEN